LRSISLCRILLAVSQILLLPDEKTRADRAGNDVTMGSDGNPWLDVFNVLMNLGFMARRKFCLTECPFRPKDGIPRRHTVYYRVCLSFSYREKAIYLVI
jgi:hypothetical protein